MNNNARLSLNSVTYAMQAKDLLAAHGISSNVIRLNRSETSSGCAFGLQLSRRDIPAAVSLLTKADLEHRIISH